MGIERNAVVFYRNFYEAIKDLPVELKAEVLDAIMEYGLNGEEPATLSVMARTVFVLIKPSIDNNNKKYLNGKGGGRPSKKDSEQNQETDIKTKEKPNENQNEIKQEPINNIDNEYGYGNNLDIITEAELPLVMPEEVEKTESIRYERIVKRFNELLTPILPKVVVISETRKNAMKSIFNKHGPDVIELVFKKVLASRFLQGDNNHGFKCSFDWIFKQSNFIKILEGNYDDKNRTSNLSDKERANQAAFDQFMSGYGAEQSMANEVEKPF